MQTIIDLWNGNIGPGEHCGTCDPVIDDLLGLMERNREKLSQGLTEAQMETFQKFLDCSDEYFLRMLELAFGEGFRLGGKLVVEMLKLYPVCIQNGKQSVIEQTADCFLAFRELLGLYLPDKDI